MARKLRRLVKSTRERDYYIQYLKLADDEPTVEQVSEFPQSDTFKEDDTVPTEEKGRRRSPASKMSEHFKEHLFHYLISFIALIVASILVYGATDMSSRLGRIEGLIDSIQNNLFSQDNKIEKLEDTIQEHELKIQEQNIKLDYLEDSLQ